MPNRTVILPDGTPVRNVPEEVSDSQVYDRYGVVEETTPVVEEETAPAEETSISDIGLDFAKVMLRTGQSIAETAVQTASYPFAGDREERATRIGEDFDKTAQSIVRSIPIVGERLQRSMFTKEGAREGAPSQIGETKTTTGAAFSVAPYIAGGVEVAGAKALTAVPSLVRGLGAGVVVDQVLADPKENAFNVIQEVFPESAVADYTSFMATDEDDSATLARLKLIGEGLTIGALGEVLGGTVAAAKYVRGKFNKPLKNLTEEEKGEALVDYLKDSKEKAGLRETKPDVEYSETPEGAAQVAQQQSSTLSRFTRQFFTSRGYFTPKAFNAFQDSENAQRAVVSEAENVAQRLQIALDNVGDTVESKEMMDKVQEALISDLKYTRAQSKQANIIDLQDQFGFTEEVAAEVLNARNLIDETSRKLLNSSVVPLELKEVISENSGSYLRRSYRLYENVGYVPTDQARRDAEKFLTARNLRRSPAMKEDEAFALAQTQINEILDVSAEGAKTSNDYFTSVRKVNKEILKGREDIPVEIRTLMGEITNPADNVLLTVSKTAKLYETNRFYDTLGKLGQQGNYIFRKDQPRPDGFVKISGTNSSLDGQFTTPEILTAIKQQESNFLTPESNSILGKAYKNFLVMKGGSQKAKTVFSVTTHARNILGGAQFGLANGLNPFGKNSGATFKVLQNKIAKGGQQVLDDTYKRYLDLGIINTNATVNEFRDLINAGTDTLTDKGMEALASYGRGAVGKVAKTVEDVYLATDDFYKIMNFNKELDMLKKAFPTTDIKVLEAEAATIIKNTMPNYDMVPKGIKALRNLPIGSFVSFPAEILRTSGHIVRQASKEINSGNTALVARGRQRLAGFVTTLSSWSLVGSGSAALVGLSTEEKDAAHVLTEAPWSKESPRIWARIDGELYHADTQYLDSYSAIKEPIMAAYSEIREGRLKGKDLDEYLLNATVSAVKTLATPYVEPTILSTSIQDVVFAALNEDGRTPEGKAIFTEGLTGWEKTENFAYHVLDSFVPGTVNSITDIAEAYLETPNRSTGETKTLSTEIGALAGVGFQKFDPKNKLGFAVKDYVRNNTRIISANPDFVLSGEQLAERYVNRQKARLENSQELYRIIEASRKILGDDETALVLKENGLSTDNIGFFFSGKFKPEKQSMDRFLNVINKTPLQKGETSARIIEDLYSKYADMFATPLITTKDPDEDPRLRKARGGEVYDVPNAPVEPDQRIDKMTGLPYDMQAGGAYVDEEDRRMFSGGGQVIKALASIIETYSKKAIDSASATKAATEIVDTVDKAAYLDPNISTANPTYQEYLETTTKALLEEKHEMPLEQLEQVPGLNTDWEEFSTNRGYTPDEMATFGRSLELEDSLKQETGIDFSSDTSLIQDKLDQIKARNMEYPDAAEVEDVATAFPKYQTFYEDVNLSKVLSKQDYEAYNVEAGGIKDDYDLEIAYLEDEGMLDEAAELISQRDEELRALTNSYIEVPKEELRWQLKAEIERLTPAEKEVFERVYDKMPEKSQGINEVIENPSDAMEFTANSEMKEPVYRGTYTGLNYEYDIAFAVPREIGVHVGTEGQANAILIKAMDTEPSEFMSKAGLDEFYSNPELADPEMGLPLAMSKGYINVENPLVIDVDLGIWDAFYIANDEMLRNDMVKAVLDSSTEDVSPAQLINFFDKLSSPKFRDANVDRLMPNTDDFYGGILKADLNIQLREILQKTYGFDGIKYKNMGEETLPGEDGYSYILFKPNQFKNVNAASFDPEDAREMFAEGGLLSKAYKKLESNRANYAEGSLAKIGKYIIEKGGEALGVGPKQQRLNEKKVATFINDAVEKGMMPREYKVPVDERGFGDFKQPFNEEAFNAFNHALLSYNYGKTPMHRAALQLKETMQGYMRTNPKTEKLDAVNNKFGFKLRDRAKNEDEALADMLMGYYKTHGKLQLGKPLKEGEDIIFNVNDLELID